MSTSTVSCIHTNECSQLDGIITDMAMNDNEQHKKRVLAHLKNCPGCQKMYDEIRGVAGKTDGTFPVGK